MTGTQSTQDEQRRATRGPQRLVVLVVGALLALLVLVACGDETSEPGASSTEATEAASPESGDASETATASEVTDADRDEVVAAAETAAVAVLSYDHRSLEQDRDAALEFMTTAYGDSYRSTFDAAVLPSATDAEATVEAEVQETGITAIDGDSAEVLVFVDQSTTTAESPEPMAALNRITLTLVREDSEWLIDEIRSDGFARPDDDAVRVEVMAVGARFAEVWNTFEPAQAREYVDTVTPLLTPRFADEFTASSDSVVEGIEDQQLSSTGRALGSAVSALDADSATVLVASDAERTSDGKDVVRHWRWSVDLVLVDGTWLVDSFEEV
ncbi:hypothetical protein G7072_00055 [Nocardioides sp. HDW12B]|uniref:hypothetical protein n=1 Tax=Nocardioides sp. HDW12B TaxID=2714939 RepID=UPI0014087A07|nr:hypothetical protein [Nocardioides sp. HDW12B]QIK64937.1 hypothetical protein G7072_00055 [Nocardioides sp. HDW12B]